MKKLSNIQGPLLIMLAASLWAVDALIRTPLTKLIPSAAIVFYENLFGLLVLSPLFVRSVPILKKIPGKTWGYIFIMSFFGNVAGNVLFTQALASSFATHDFITPLLLLKLQPVFVIVLSAVILKEKIHRQFLLWAALALVGSYVMNFGLTPIKLQLSGKELIVLLSLGATLCWGIGTILSKYMLRTYSGRDTTFVRFLIATPIAFVVSIALNQYHAPLELTSPSFLRFVTIALSTGAVGLMIYYAGLVQTKAHISTIAELMFPLVSIIIGITSLNPYGAPQTMTVQQGIGIIILLIAITKITLLHAKQSVVNVTGLVVKGAGDGKKMGFPTANIELDTPLDLNYGVYACTISLKSKVERQKILKGIVHYGPRVVFGEEKPQFEVHIFDFKQNVYGTVVHVELNGFIRGTQQFGSVEALKNQMEKDCAKAREILESRS